MKSGGTAGSDNGTLLVYHFDNLGSTKLVTDRAGKSVCKFDYGTYGELLTTEYLSVNENSDYVPRISFLYNGQYGVITDDNGLYYMRSRYYNPEIKRFINQDILTGSIGNSASLNRYSYVEGNPVSYTDPFGLSPFSYMSGWIKIPKSIHIALECLGCIPGCDVFDYINAGLYLLEGDVNGVIRALPVANLFGKYSNYFIKGTRILSFGICGFGEDLLKNVRINCTPDIDTLNNLIGMNALGMHSTTDTPQIKTSDDVIPNPNKNMEEELSYKNNENYGNTSGSTEFNGGSEQLLLEKTPTRRELAEQKLAESASGINNKTIDSRTNMEVGRFIGDDRGNVFIEPVGGSTVPAGRNGVDTHTLYPNGSNYNRYNPVGHRNNTTPHGHGHLIGTGPGIRGQGPSIDVLGNIVPFNSSEAHWTIH